MQQAVRMDPHPDYFERVERLRREFTAQANETAVAKKEALPSPANAKEAEELDRRRIQIDEARHKVLEKVTWEKGRHHLGSCYALAPERLREPGLTQNRLSCLTGATKRLGFQGRLDDQALVGFFRQMAQDARADLALLDSPEELVAMLATFEATEFGKRSAMPEVLCLLPRVAGRRPGLAGKQPRDPKAGRTEDDEAPAPCKARHPLGGYQAIVVGWPERARREAMDRSGLGEGLRDFDAPGANADDRDGADRCASDAGAQSRRRRVEANGDGVQGGRSAAGRHRQSLRRVFRAEMGGNTTAGNGP